MHSRYKFKKIRHSGYTLVEVLMAVTIFFAVLAGPTGLFVFSLRGQLKALASREIIDNSSYALEYISRALRMAKKDTDATCIGAAPDYSNYENPGSDISKIRFLNYQGFCQEFALILGQIAERKSADASKDNLALAEFLPLTSDDLEITPLVFRLVGESQADNLQPRVAIIFEAKKKNQAGTKMSIQTTISQRNLDVAY